LLWFPSVVNGVNPPRVRLQEQHWVDLGGISILDQSMWSGIAKVLRSMADLLDPLAAGGTVRNFVCGRA
jgi:hypothetical protein